jgi:hypothetical protein
MSQSKWKTLSNQVKNVFATFLEDQTELEIASTNAEFAHKMSRQAKLNKQQTKDSDAFNYFEHQEKKWLECARAIEEWIFTSASYRMAHKCPEYQDFEL